MGHMGHRWEAHQTTKGWRSPHREGSLDWTRGGGGVPLSFSPSLSFPLPPPVKGKGGGGQILLGAQVGLLLLGARLWLASSPSLLYIRRGGGTLNTHQLFQAVC